MTGSRHVLSRIRTHRERVLRIVCKISWHNSVIIPPTTVVRLYNLLLLNWLKFPQPIIFSGEEVDFAFWK